jgi:hypothetical protein
MGMGFAAIVRKSERTFKGSRKNNFPILCADASCLAVLPKRRNISICLRLGALPDRRLNT